MPETAQAYQWIYSTAAADSALVAAATGGIWQGLADIGVMAPYMSYSRQSGSDVLTASAVRVWSDILMQIKAVGPASNYTALVTIATRIDALFGRAGPVGIGGVAGVQSCYRESEVALEELVNGVQWSHLGGLYRIALKGS